ncbi:Cysteine-rich repeat secretory protein 60 [Platanthera zijinensis]|uniref:Cysteine-rich repeat secretory protein 60 n=1 Tax=Platanthera zijinensis TaxID=2320716 RepID=A0AAP0BEU7_9ASPA
MSPATPPSLLPLLLLLLLLPSAPSAGEDLAAVVYSTCSGEKYNSNSPYKLNLDSLLSSLSAAAGFSLYSKFVSADSPSATPISGLFQCTGDLSIPDCSSCVRDAVLRLPSLCSSATAASLQLRGCFLRYGKGAFFGLPDTNLRYKTCSTGGNSGGGDFLAAREAAFAAVSAAPVTGSSYRVATAGPVQAGAQCTGDLSLRDCDGCVGAAASQVKQSCGGAASGEAYLGTCYIWYSGGGAVPYNPGRGKEESSYDNKLDESNKPQVFLGDGNSRKIEANYNYPII